MALTPKQQRFVEEYLIDQNATQAACRCGYSAKTAKQQGSRLLTNVDVASAIATATAARSKRVGVDADRVLEEVRRLALSDVRALFTDSGDLRPLSELSDEQAAAIAGVEVIIKNAKAGDGVTDTIHKIKVWDKPKSLEMLMKHLGLFEERTHVTGTLELVWAGDQSSGS